MDVRASDLVRTVLATVVGAPEWPAYRVPVAVTMEHWGFTQDIPGLSVDANGTVLDVLELVIKERQHIEDYVFRELGQRVSIVEGGAKVLVAPSRQQPYREPPSLEERLDAACGIVDSTSVVVLLKE